MFAQIEDYIYGLIVSALTSLAGGVWWLIRRVMTNQKQIEMLRLEIGHRDKLRSEDRERISNIEQGVSNIEHILMGKRK